MDTPWSMLKKVTKPQVILTLWTVAGCPSVAQGGLTGFDRPIGQEV